MKNIIDAFIKLSISIFLLTMIVGCGIHKTYTGHYFIDKCKPKFANNDAINKTSSVIFLIADEFGLKKEAKEYQGQYYETFVKQKNLVGKYDHLKGSNPSIILIYFKEPLSITIRDFENISETPFISKLKFELESKLKNICTEQPVFKRDSEFWY